MHKNKLDFEIMKVYLTFKACLNLIGVFLYVAHRAMSLS